MDEWPFVLLYSRMNEPSFREQVIKRLEETSLPVTELARRSGVPKGALYKLLQRPGASTKAENARAIARVLGLEAPSEGAQELEVREMADPALLALVPVYDVGASAGHGLIPDDYVPVTRMVAFAVEYLRVIIGVDPKHAAIITVVGDSMAPTVEDGDFVLVDMTAADFDREGIYVFFHDGSVHVKRVMRSSRAGHILAIPDNPRYREQEYPIEEVRMIGRVKFGGGIL